MAVAVKTLGVDEAGLGPSVGPLVVAGVLVEGDGGRARELGIKESKKLFKRKERGWRELEAWALGVLGTGAKTPRQLFRELGLKLPGWHVPGGELPVWGGEPKSPPIKVLTTRVRVALPGDIRRHRNRFSLDFAMMMDLVEEIRAERSICGKVGGRNKYPVNMQPIVEGRERSAYRGRGRVVEFWRDAEEFGVVALASLVAKYIRELLMLGLSQAAGFGGRFPAASGYPGDPKTKTLIEALKKALPRECFLR